MKTMLGSLPYRLLGVILLGEIPVILRRHRKEAERRDRGSFWAFMAVVGVGYYAAFSLPPRAAHVPALAAVLAPLTLGAWAAPVAVALTLGGTAFRLWSILTLGRYFTPVVRVSQDQQVVTAGPYRYLRHPSYTGGWAAMMGMGLSLGNWLSFASIVLPGLACYAYRIYIEEAALTGVLGRPYQEYMARTRRLIPFVW